MGLWLKSIWIRLMYHFGWIHHGLEPKKNTADIPCRIDIKM